jgi:hypothetical protein
MIKAYLAVPIDTLWICSGSKGRKGTIRSVFTKITLQVTSMIGKAFTQVRRGKQTRIFETIGVLLNKSVAIVPGCRTVEMTPSLPCLRASSKAKRFRAYNQCIIMRYIGDQVNLGAYKVALVIHRLCLEPVSCRGVFKGVEVHTSVHEVSE